MERELIQLENTKKLIEMKRPHWEKEEQQVEELHEFTQSNLDINSWDVYIKSYGVMTFKEFMIKADKEVKFGRYVEVTDAFMDLMKNLDVQLKGVRDRYLDVVRKLTYTNEEKAMSIDEILSQTDLLIEEMKTIISENDKLREQNEKLRDMIEFSMNSYEQMNKIVEVKINDMMELYDNFDNIKSEKELQEYIKAIKIELQVGRKPIEAKRNFILKKQKEEFDLNTFDIIDEVTSKNEVITPEIEVDEKPTVKLSEKELKKQRVDKFKEEIDKAKNGEVSELDDVDDNNISDADMKINESLKYARFKIHSDFMYNEDDYDQNEGFSEEEKEARSKLIKAKLETEDYALESEVDYTDKSNYNRSRVATLVQMDSEYSHINFGLNSVQWLKRYKIIYNDNLEIINTGLEDKKFSPTQLKQLDKLRRKSKKEKDKIKNEQKN